MYNRYSCKTSGLERSGLERSGHEWTRLEKSGDERSGIRKVLGTKGPDAKGPEESIRVQKVRICLFSKTGPEEKVEIWFFPKNGRLSISSLLFFLHQRRQNVGTTFPLSKTKTTMSARQPFSKTVSCFVHPFSGPVTIVPKTVSCFVHPFLVLLPLFQNWILW